MTREGTATEIVPGSEAWLRKQHASLTSERDALVEALKDLLEVLGLDKEPLSGYGPMAYVLSIDEAALVNASVAAQAALASAQEKA